LAERLFEFNMGPNFRCQNLCVDFVSIGKRIVTINSVNNTFRYSLPLVKESHRLKTNELQTGPYLRGSLRVQPPPDSKCWKNVSHCKNYAAKYLAAGAWPCRSFWNARGCHRVSI